MKTTMKNSLMLFRQILFLIIALVLSGFSSCENEKPSDEEYVETMNSGKLTVYCDESLLHLMDTVFQWYKQDYDKVELTVVTGNGRSVMAKLLSGDARVIVLGRDYLNDEDSLMKVYDVSEHLKLPIAYEALVLFAKPDFPLDTINTSQIRTYLTSKNNSLSINFPVLQAEPELVCSGINSSEFANLKLLAAGNDSIVRNVKLLENSDAVKKYVSDNVNRIGICFLSQIVGDTSYKLIKLGFTDTNSRAIRPRPVHQAYIVQDLYPYKVTLWAYLLEDRRNLPFWFGKYLSIEEKVQRYFLNSGIVPAFARIKLIPEE